MSKEFKHLQFLNIKAKDDNPRTKTGIAAVFGNVDSWGDRIHAGAFTKTIQEGQKRVRHLWNHNSSNPPIATILELREVSRDELPDEVIAKAPEATGGLLVKREYYDSPFSNWVLEAIEKEDVNEMSFAFETVKSSQTVEDTGFEDMPKRYIRELLELKLYDTSDVNWGMNLATVAAGAKDYMAPMSLGQIYSNFKALETEMKEGRRNADSDQALLNQIHGLAVDLGAKCEIKENQDDSTEEGKAGAVNIDTSLNADWIELQKAKARTLQF